MHTHEHYELKSHWNEDLGVLILRQVGCGGMDYFTLGKLTATRTKKFPCVEEKAKLTGPRIRCHLLHTQVALAMSFILGKALNTTRSKESSRLLIVSFTFPEENRHGNNVPRIRKRLQWRIF